MRFRDLFREDVWHGSPHKFKQFSLAHVGNGEGHARFGWGVYVGGKRDVADFYSRSLARDFTYNGRRVDPESHLHTAIYQWLYHEGDLDAVRAGWKQGAAIHKVIDRLDPEKIGVRSYIYHAEMPDDSEFLRWDAPFDAQSPLVKRAIEKLVVVPQAVQDAAASASGDGDVWAVWDRMAQNKTVRAPTGGTIYEILAHQVGGDRNASLALLSAGVHGIAYIESGSRSRDWKTVAPEEYNYVIFDDRRLRIKSVGRPTARI